MGVMTQSQNADSSRLGDTGRKWVTTDETTFVGQTGDGIILIVGDDEQVVGRALELLFETLQQTTP